MANLRLTFVIEGLGGGGAQRVLALLSGALADLGCDVCVVTYAGGSPARIALDPRVVHMGAELAGHSRNPIEALVANLKRVRVLRRLISESRPDAVIALVGTTNILTVLACARMGVPVVISERNDPAAQSLGRVWDMLRRRYYRRADLVTANSPGALDSLADYVPREKLAFVPNPLVPVDRARLPDTRSPVVLAVGRLVRQKGFDVLVEAFGEFARARPDWRLVILGEGPDRAMLEAKAAACGLSGRVSFEGFVDPADYYEACAMFVQSSRFEGTSNALLEAMGHACPCVVTAVPGGLPEWIGHDRNALFVPPVEPVELARAMSAVADDAKLANRLGGAARAAVADFSPDAVARVWLGLLERFGLRVA